MVGQSNYLAIVGGGRNPKFPQNKVCVPQIPRRCLEKPS